MSLASAGSNLVGGFGPLPSNLKGTTMTQERFLQHPDGTIHGWNQWLAQEPGMIEVTAEMAYPERFVKGGKRKAAVDMTTDPPADPPNEVNQAAGLQAGKQADKKVGA